MGAKGAALFRFRGGKVMRHVVYLDRGRAFRRPRAGAGGCGRSTELSRRQRGIRSSGKSMKMVDHAQGWQGLQHDRIGPRSDRSRALVPSCAICPATN